jgi:molybdenum cofactor biosynthesis enzyme MoaA
MNSDFSINLLFFFFLEPTIRRDLVDIIRGIRAYPSIKTIGITTNGVVLHRLLEPLAEAGLNSLNISLDTLIKEKFEFLTRRSAFARVLTNIRLALDMPNLYPLVKINCVVMQNVNTDELNDFVELTRDQPNLAVRFIEYMPFSDNKWNERKYFPYQEMLKIIQQKYQLEKIAENDKNDTTKWYRVKGSAYQGKVGFITSMSEHFCSTCNRVRITADGQLKVSSFVKREVPFFLKMYLGMSI